MLWTAWFALAAAAAYAGFQWTVRVLVYPQFARVDPAAFADYEAAHQRRITPLVGVLFVALGSAAVLLFGWPPAGVSRLPGLLSGVLVAGILALTGLRAVPCHRRLTGGWDAGAFAALLRVDSARVALATLNVLCAALALR